MFKLIAPLAVAATLCAGMPAANAMPLLTVGGADAPHLTLVSGGCGPYGHRNPWGHCRPGGGWGGGYGYGYGGGYWSNDRCPVNYHLGAHGRLCWPNA